MLCFQPHGTLFLQVKRFAQMPKLEERYRRTHVKHCGELDSVDAKRHQQRREQRAQLFRVDQLRGHCGVRRATTGNRYWAGDGTSRGRHTSFRRPSLTSLAIFKTRTSFATTASECFVASFSTWSEMSRKIWSNLQRRQDSGRVVSLVEGFRRCVACRAVSTHGQTVKKSTTNHDLRSARAKGRASIDLSELPQA